MVSIISNYYLLFSSLYLFKQNEEDKDEEKAEVDEEVEKEDAVNKFDIWWSAKSILIKS